jgi:hypothetical protein
VIGIQLVALSLTALTSYQVEHHLTSWALLAAVAAVAANAIRARRRRITVGRAGIVASWGFGHGRTYPWHEIRWISAVDYQVQGTPARAVRITLADGRTRTLPLLHHSTVYPNPRFETDYLRVIRWWHAGTEPTDRIQPPPPEQPKKRLSPKAQERVLALLGFVVFLAVFALTKLDM